MAKVVRLYNLPEHLNIDHAIRQRMEDFGQIDWIFPRFGPFNAIVQYRELSEAQNACDARNVAIGDYLIALRAYEPLPGDQRFPPQPQHAIYVHNVQNPHAVFFAYSFTIIIVVLAVGIFIVRNVF